MDASQGHTAAEIDRLQFASDNVAPMLPEALEHLRMANSGFAPAYGADAWTKRATEAIRNFFETDCEVYFVFGGTGGNALGLSTLARRYEGIVAHCFSHAQTDECGAPEFFTGGAKLLLVEGPEGKVLPESLDEVLQRGHGIHSSRPGVLTISNSTEVGTVYGIEEVAALGEAAKRLGWLFHCDGARFFNALAHARASPSELTWKAGLDLLTFGGTKAGLLPTEALVFFNKGLVRDFNYQRKQGGQLASKMRYISAPWLGLLEADRGLKAARRANACAYRLACGLESLGIELACPCEANAVFPRFSEAQFEALHGRGWHFYPFHDVHAHRLMCCWATEDAAIDTFLADCQEILERR